MATDTDEDRAARRRLGEAIRQRREVVLECPIGQLAKMAGVEVDVLAALEAGTYVKAYELPQRHPLQDALGWVPGSFERVLIEGKEPLLLVWVREGPQ
jgi:hypothetical protein